MELTSTAFEDDAPIPSHYTCDGQGTNPPLHMSGVPTNAKSLVLIMDDPDVPKEVRADGVFDHWVLFNISPGISEISESVNAETIPGVLGANGVGTLEYIGPCPPPEYEPNEHRYVFALYALDTELSLPEGTSKQEVLGVMQGHVLAETKLIGRYCRV